MAQVPYQPVPTVAPSTEGTPNISVGAPGAAFGAGVAKELGDAGQMLFTNAMQMQQLQNEADVNQAMTDYLIKSGELDNAFRLLQGNKAQAQLPQHIQALTELRANSRAGLNPMAQKLFDRETMRRYGYDVVNASNYAATQAKAFHKQSVEANQIAMADRTAKDPYNTKYMDDVIQGTIDSETKLSLDEGDTNPMTKVRVQQKVGRVISAVSASMARHDPDSAKGLLERWKDKIPEVDYLKALDTVNTRAVQVHSAMDARRLVGGEAAVSPQDANLVVQIAATKGWTGGTFTPENISRLVSQESGWQNLPPNKAGYAGFFQMKPKEFGLTPDDFAKMSFEDQLNLYASQYLTKHGYTGVEDLGVMNAAPAFSKASDSAIAYPAGSIEAVSNPQWVKYSNAGGAVTVGGIKAWAAAGVSGLTPETNMSKLLDKGAQLAKMRFPGNPVLQEQYLEAFQTRLRSNAALQRSELKTQMQANRNGIDETLFKIGANGLGPRDLDEAMAIDPNFQQKWETAKVLNPTISKHIKDTFQYWSNVEHRTGTLGWEARVDAANGLAAGLHPGDIEQFLAISPASLGAPYGVTEKIRAKQLAVQKKAQDTARLNSYLRAVQPQLADAGIYANNPGEYNQFVGAFQAKIEDWESKNPAKRLPEADAKGMAASLIRERGGWWGFFTTRNFEVPSSFITEEMQNKFEKRFGHAPTPADIYRLYQLSKTP